MDYDLTLTTSALMDVFRQRDGAGLHTAPYGNIRPRPGDDNATYELLLLHSLTPRPLAARRLKDDGQPG